ncbi:MAG: hypothetical protein MUP55_00520 [Candidatus Aenigmarchaeota archaeon]|nr:hypothetical protein [Candidatus Aenigmarchaeota archaeon]
MEKYQSGVEFKYPLNRVFGSCLPHIGISIYSQGDFEIEENPPELFEDIEVMRPKRISTIKTEADLVLDEIYRGITEKQISDDYIPKKEKELISEEIQAFA